MSGERDPVDPAATFQGVERREASAVPSAVPVASVPPAPTRRWDAGSGAWVLRSPDAPPDPSAAEVDEPSEPPPTRFDFPRDPRGATRTPVPRAAPPGPLARLLRWLGGRGPDRPR